MRQVVFTFLLIISSITLWGQLDNTVFENRMKVEPADSDKLFLGVNILGFVRNNEYFDTVVDGYTLFGYQLNPYLSYRLGKSVRLDAGIYVQKDFGNDKYSSVLPAFSAKIKKGNFNLVLGTLDGSLNHRLIEPLYDFEKVLNQRMENGIQVGWIKDDLFLDAWVDWQEMIYHGDDDQERFTAGLSINKRVFSKDHFSVSVPLQGIAFHRGGQIDNNPNPVLTVLQGATGIELSNHQAGLISEWGMKGYVVFHKTSSDEFLFQDGMGLYLNPYLKTKVGLTVMGTYWHGEEFLSKTGGLLYPSSNELYPSRMDEVRSFFMLRMLYDIKVEDSFTLTLRAEPFYDTYAGALQYSIGFYVNFYNWFFLVKSKHE